MKLLLDTHAFLWWLDGDRRLPARMRALIQEESNTIVVSAASAWEITTKVRLGRLPGAVDIAADVGAAIASQGFTALDMSVRHARKAGGLPGRHRDPFDRMLIAQSQIEDLPIVSNEAVFDEYSVNRVW